MKSETRPSNDVQGDESQHARQKKQWQTPSFELHEAKGSTLANKAFNFPIETTSTVGPAS